MIRKCIMILMILPLLYGCTIREGTEDKVRDVEFTVLSRDDVPQEFLEFILEKQEEPFKLTYTTEEYLYIAVGYGRQESGGYSIAIKDFYLTENTLVIDTELIGPSVSADQIPAESFPFAVIKTEKMDQTVVFQ